MVQSFWTVCIGPLHTYGSPGGYNKVKLSQSQNSCPTRTVPPPPHLAISIMARALMCAHLDFNRPNDQVNCAWDGWDDGMPWPSRWTLGHWAGLTHRHKFHSSLYFGRKRRHTRWRPELLECVSLDGPRPPFKTLSSTSRLAHPAKLISSTRSQHSPYQIWGTRGGIDVCLSENTTTPHVLA